ncbi:MAG: hypothetical protein U1C04_18910 [Hydrogenophaga sp.]|uniref:hypothetical protein n=1 Tax=Hydrogenophaga sp. TaxID=1904254 RepID=UPI002ABC2FEB|nr:hypothetical protein [Hydrogenophaga sp.]MDZ4282822.1 hypothetical protein [Hydrogenophaga sp.]
MPIQSEDIKLLKSAVMADVPEGGGAMTGVAIADGVSNNIFPDTSTDDRAAGRVNFRKVFGVAHTDDTDSLLGASFVVLHPPEDPLVHCTLFQTPGWADERTVAKELVERYLVKGPRLTCRIMDTHYAGAVLLQLYQVGGTNFPAPGEAVALRNPDGQEQYVRVLKVTLSTGSYNVSEGSGTVTFAANVAVCEIGQPLQFDLLGPPIARVVNESVYAQVFSTSGSTGVAFHGVKPLSTPAAIGDRSVVAAGGIFSPLVPAATVEEPLIDIAPLTARSSLSRTAFAAITLPATVLTLIPGTVLRLPTAVEPGTLTMAHGATTFTADPDGAVKQGTTVVGLLDHKERTLTMNPGSPAYGSASNTITYKPATVAGATVHSDFWTITTANQGLGWVYAFEPPPAPGTLSVSYMAQGRWYELVDNGAGKLAGADSSYGTGTLNYTTGSLAMTLGALPDVGSALIFQWGNAEAARQAVGTLPTRAHTDVVLPHNPEPGSISLSWSRGATPYSATVAANGTVTGPADVGPAIGAGFGNYAFSFAPHTLPDGDVTVNYSRSTSPGTGFTNGGGGNYTLTGAPIKAGSVRATITLDVSGLEGVPETAELYSVGTVLYAQFPGKKPFARVVGSVNNTTGAIVINSSVANVSARVVSSVTDTSPSGNSYTVTSVVTALVSVPIDRATVGGFSYLPDSAGAAESLTHTPSWALTLADTDGLSYRINGLAFLWGSQLYSSIEGAMRKGWNHALGVGDAAGAASSEGGITLTAMPDNGLNSISWANLAQDLAEGLTIYQGTYRVLTAPIKTGGFQQQSGPRVGLAADTGVITGGDFAGSVDFQRGIVKWSTLVPVSAETLTYNAVFLQYLPLDGTLLGLETARLPLDGKVPIYRPGGQVLVHNTLETTLVNPLVKGTSYDLGRERIAAVIVRTLAGVKVPASLYDVDFDNGEIVFPVESDLTGLDQPFTVSHRIEDELMVLRADISGKLDLVAGITHNYPADTSFVSSKLRKGDLFARAFNYKEQSTWTGVWSDELIGSAPTASFNDIDYPIEVTNRGALTERWAVIFTGATQVRVVGENVGQVLTGVSITAAIAPLNPQTGAPYFEIDALGWGGGWSAGNVLRFNTEAAGSPAWVARTVLQGPPTVASDKFTLAFRSDVDA